MLTLRQAIKWAKDEAEKKDREKHPDRYPQPWVARPSHFADAGEVTPVPDGAAPRTPELPRDVRGIMSPDRHPMADDDELEVDEGEGLPFPLSVSSPARAHRRVV